MDKLTKAQLLVLKRAEQKQDLYGDCVSLSDFGGRRQTVNALWRRKLLWSDGKLTDAGKAVLREADDEQRADAEPPDLARMATG